MMMANYFNWIYTMVHAQKDEQRAGITSWYVIPPSKPLLPVPTYNSSTFPVADVSTIIMEDLKRDLHFTMKMENTGDEGFYGMLHYCQLPELELGLDMDIASFLAGAISCTVLGLYLHDIYRPRKLIAWWPTRWFFHFLEEGIYLGRSTRWFANAVVIAVKTICRAIYGGLTHTLSRILYYWIKKCVTRGKVPYTPLVDDTYAAIFSGYMWTAYSLKSEEYTLYDRIIYMGWSAVFTGLLEYCLFQYFLKEPPPGLYRWLLGGAFYGQGVWRYLEMGDSMPLRGK